MRESNRLSDVMTTGRHIASDVILDRLRRSRETCVLRNSWNLSFCDTNIREKEF